jgi:hypothetical protein
MSKSFEIQSNKTIRELLNDSFLINLPISGGNGCSIEDAIIMEVTEENEYVETEYLVLEFLGYLRSVGWHLIQQKLFSVGDKKYDCLEISVVDLMDRTQAEWKEKYYFDITECYEINAKLFASDVISE